MRVFLSAATSQFEASRDSLRSDLTAIGCRVREQKDFQTGPRSLIERLEEYIAACDRVVALVGHAYGSEAAADSVPARDPPRSYTQWEYYLALGERLNRSRAEPKDLYVYVASDAFLDSHPVYQSDELAARQNSFVQQLKQSGKHWAEFDSIGQLRALVLRDSIKIVETASGRDPDQPKDELAAWLLNRSSEYWRLDDVLPLARRGTIHTWFRKPIERAIRAYLDETLGAADLQIVTGNLNQSFDDFERWQERERKVKNLLQRVLARVPDEPLRVEDED